MSHLIFNIDKGFSSGFKPLKGFALQIVTQRGHDSGEIGDEAATKHEHSKETPNIMDVLRNGPSTLAGSIVMPCKEMMKP